MNAELKYRRILLKLTGELFGDKKGDNLDFLNIEKVAREIIKIKQATGIEIAVVVGAGNIFRGRDVEDSKVDRITADQIGMLGTIMNALALQEALERFDQKTRLISGIEIPNLSEPFRARLAKQDLEKGKILIFGGGIGQPFFTTDTTAALRACELNCYVLLKASNVDGLYDKDPRKHNQAALLRNTTYQTVLEKNLNVVDTTSLLLCKEQQIPIIVFNSKKLYLLKEILEGKEIGTLVH